MRLPWPIFPSRLGGGGSIAKTQTPAPLTDSGFWRRVLARVHPDAGGNHEEFLFLSAARERVESCRGRCDRGPGPGPECGGSRSYETGADRTGADRIRFPEGRVDHVELVARARGLARGHGRVLGAVLARLAGYQQATSGRARLAEQRGATYKQVRYLAALADVAPREMYEAAERVPMSQAMVGYLITELKEREGRRG